MVDVIKGQTKSATTSMDIIRKLWTLYKTFIDLDDSYPSTIATRIAELESSILQANQSPDLSEILEDVSALQTLRKTYEAFETKLEGMFASHLIKGTAHNYRHYPLYDRFRGLIRSEIDQARITANDTVLFLGSGSFPITAILLTQLTGCRVHCYEREEERVYVANEVVSSLHLDRWIDVVNGDDREAGYGSCTVIMIAVLAQPKVRILTEIGARAAPGTRMVCRTTIGAQRLFYQEAPSSILRRFTPFSQSVTVAGQTISSVFLQTQ